MGQKMGEQVWGSEGLTGDIQGLSGNLQGRLSHGEIIYLLHAGQL